MRKLPAILLALFTLSAAAQTYQPNWESLDARPTPAWFRDAKFGIFIHWGVYAVPGWSSKGNYAEWYQQGLQTTDTARQKFHKARFGERSYYDLANDFKAELFNPDEWARLFEQSGARYIVLTSKHHDGFTLWPSAEANRTWGFKWNAVDVGPHRDLLGDLFKAVRKTRVHAGMYYSLYEWFNPLWKSDRAKFVEQHTWPQMKELINTYQPDVFWTDGDWDAPAETWKSQEFLTWLFNESPVKDKVVVNDRWGSGLRFHHAGIYTPEYQPDLSFDDHYWEESRGMGYSYGYNREEDAWDYNSTQSLVLQLIDKVSRGGNFLLDIGPDEHGKIPPIMQERLLGIGEWLKVNGEAIYETTPWKKQSQWSEGRRDYRDRSGDMLLKITVDPDPGYAVKEIFYTYSPGRHNLYAIFPRYPDDRVLKLKEVSLPAGTRVTLLATGARLDWKVANGSTEIQLPIYNPNEVKAPQAYVVRIENYGDYFPAPRIKADYSKNQRQPEISMTGAPGAGIYYTLDGTEPGLQSQLYAGPFMLNRPATIRAISAAAGERLPSNSVQLAARVYDWKKAVNLHGVKPGLRYRYIEPAGKIDSTVFQLPETASGTTDQLTNALKKRADRFALEFTGYLRVPKDGMYRFYTLSDDGSLLNIDGELVVDNSGDHGELEKEGKVLLRKGYHALRVRYYDSGGGNSLKVMMQAEGGEKTTIPPAQLAY